MSNLMELVEEYGELCYEHGRLGADFGAEEAYDKAGERLDEIRAAVAELERDAARYRWLRYNASFTIYSFLFGEPSMAHHAESDLDAAIDAAMEAAK